MMKNLNKIKSERGDVANIHLAFKDFGVGMNAHYEFYKAIILDDDLPLNRKEREYLATETSKANECPYCIEHHAEALENTKASFELDLNKEVILKNLSNILTQEPYKTNHFKKKFLSSGYSEAQWQHAVMVVSYFNFVNRCAHAQNVKLEDNYSKTCN